MGSYIHMLEGGKKGWRYGSGLAVYTERLIDGRLISAAYQDTGIPILEKHEGWDQPVYNVPVNEEGRAQPAFNLVIDGEALYYGWEFVGFEQNIGKDDFTCGVLILKNTIKPVMLTITTYCSEFGFFKRMIEITNISKETTLGITSLTPLCGNIWEISDNLRENLKCNTVVPYSVGHFKDFFWTHEGNFDWQDIPLNTEISYSAKSGKSGHSNPFFILRNNIYGGYFVCQLGWSANWKMSFISDFHNAEFLPQHYVHLNFSIMPVCTPPARLITPGETVKAPDVHFGISHEDLDSAIYSLHAYQRKHVLKSVGDGVQPVIYNNWGYMEGEISDETLKREIDIADQIGAEMFVVDAGWYCGKGADWMATTGDWYTQDKLPNDLFPAFEYARSKGLKCGLWMEVESAGHQSKIAKEHPDWFITRYGKTVERILDLTKSEVIAFIESEINRVIEKYKLDLFRIDYNIYNANEGGFNKIDGRYENTLWRHVENLYGVLDRVAERFPELQLENCAGGGGRTDIGMVSRFTSTWVSDWFRMPRTVRILNGMSMALPPEYINRSFGVFLNACYRGNIDTLMHVAVMAHPTISGITPALSEANPEVMKCVKKYISIYKDFIRPFHREAKVYHHTPVIPGVDGEGWCALEYVSENQCQAAAVVFRLLNADCDVYFLKFRGLNNNLNYRLAFEPDGNTAIVSGYMLSQEGLAVRLDSALTSKMILLSAEPAFQNG